MEVGGGEECHEAKTKVKGAEPMTLRGLVPFRVNGLELVVFMAACSTRRTHACICGPALRLARAPARQAGIEILARRVALGRRRTGETARRCWCLAWQRTRPESSAAHLRRFSSRRNFPPRLGCLCFLVRQRRDETWATDGPCRRCRLSPARAPPPRRSPSEARPSERTAG